MASVMFVNSKSALVFAGGVILAAGLFASVFTPLEPKQSDAPEEAETEKPAPKRAAPAKIAVSEPVFQNYTGPEGNEDNLIDDTAGFDTSPMLDDTQFSDDDYYDSVDTSQSVDPDLGPDTIASSSASRSRPARSNTQRARSSRGRTRPPAKKGMTIKEMQERLALPPRVSDTDN